MSRFGLAVSVMAGKQKELGSIPLWLSLSLSSKVVIGDTVFVTLPLRINGETLE